MHQLHISVNADDDLIIIMMKVLIIVCVLQSIFTSAQAASLRGSGSFLSNEDYESCIVSCSEEYDTESSEFGQCRTECNEAYADDITHLVSHVVGDSG